MWAKNFAEPKLKYLAFGMAGVTTWSIQLVVQTSMSVGQGFFSFFIFFFL